MATRAGYVALVGRPNAGKSTLMNRLVGEHLSIVTPKAQTTWQRVTGILTDDDAQLVFLDTPGLLEVKDLFQRSMLAAAVEALEEADVVLLVLDGSRIPTDADRSRLEEVLGEVRAHVVVALNKVDRNEEAALEAWRRWLSEHPAWTVHEISALEGTGVDALLADVRARLPEGPFLYPPDDLAAQPVRFFVAELVRECVFEHYEQEIPYSVITHVEEMREDRDPVYIQVTIFVERPSQKGILIGKRGAAIRALGVCAREKIEHFLGRRAYLDLWVKPLKGWRRNRAHLRRLGYRVPAEGEDPRAR